MTAKEQFISDLKKIQAMLAKEQPNSDGWWKIKELRNQCQIAWGQAANMAIEVSSLEVDHLRFYVYMTSPYREWIDGEEQVNIDNEVEQVINNN